MPHSIDRTDRDSWSVSCSRWALGIAGQTIFAGVLLVGLISALPSLEIPRDAAQNECESDCGAQRSYVQNLHDASDQRSIWVSRHSRMTERIDVSTGLPTERLPLPSGYLSGIRINPEGTRILYIGSEGTLTAGRRDDRDWDLQTVLSSRGEIFQHALSPVADLLAIATNDSVEVWSFREKLHSLAMIPRSGRVSKMEWSPDGCHLLILTSDGGLEIRHGQTLAAMQTAQTSMLGNGSCFWSLGGQHLAATDRRGVVAVWDLEQTGDGVRHIQCKPHTAAALSNDGRWLAIPDMSRRLWLINVITPENRHNLGELSADPCAVRFAANDSLLVVGSTNGSLQCWSLDDQQFAWFSSDSNNEDSPISEQIRS